MKHAIELHVSPISPDECGQLEQLVLDNTRSLFQRGCDVTTIMLVTNLPPSGLPPHTELPSGWGFRLEFKPGAKWGENNYRAALMSMVRTVAADLDARFYTCVSEAWVSSQSEVSPSEDPNRYEAVMVTVETRDCPSQVYLARVTRDVTQRLLGEWQALAVPGGRLVWRMLDVIQPVRGCSAEDRTS